MTIRCPECGSWEAQCMADSPVKGCGCARCLSAENAALRKDADATRRRQLYELAGYLSVELPELHGVLGGRLVNAVDAYRAKIGDGIRPGELT